MGNTCCQLLRDDSIVELSLCQVIINGGNMSVKVNNVNSVSEALEDVSKAIDTISTYVE